MIKKILVLFLLAVTPIIKSMESGHEKRNAELREAIKKMELILVRECLENGADPNTVFVLDDQVETPALIYALTDQHENSLIIGQELLKHKANPNGRKLVRIFGSITCLHALLHYTGITNCNAKIRLLLDHGAQIDAEDGDNNTPLHYANSNGKPSHIPLLLSTGADINRRNSYGKTPLSMALYKRDKKAVLLLLTNKIQPPSFNYGDLHPIAQQYPHLFYMAKADEERYRSTGYDKPAKIIRDIGKALIQFEGIYTNRGRIAHRGLGAASLLLPIDILKKIAMHMEYPFLYETTDSKIGEQI